MKKILSLFALLAGCGGIVAEDPAPKVDSGAKEGSAESCGNVGFSAKVPACPDTIPTDGTTCSVGPGTCTWHASDGCIWAMAQCVSGKWKLAPPVCGPDASYEPDGA